MSRYSKTVEKDGKKFEVSWGYDDPLLEYFLHVRDLSPRADPVLIFAIASYNTLKRHPDMPHRIHFSNSEILELMREWEVDPEHCDQVAGDLRF